MQSFVIKVGICKLVMKYQWPFTEDLRHTLIYFRNFLRIFETKLKFVFYSSSPWRRPLVKVEVLWYILLIFSRRQKLTVNFLIKPKPIQFFVVNFFSGFFLLVPLLSPRLSNIELVNFVYYIAWKQPIKVDTRHPGLW